MATVSPETVLRMTVKGDEAGIREVLASVEGVGGVTALASAEAEGTVSLKVTTPADKDLRDDICFAMAERRYAVLSMERSEQSLEEIFLSLTARKKANKNEEDSD
jgi:hypothetical protein